MNTENIFNLRPLDRALNDVFFPDTIERFGKLLNTNGKFVHYTSAEVGASIIKNASVWMRNTMTMNDFSEVEHGLHCIKHVWNIDEGRRLRAAIDEIHPGESDEAANLFDAWLPDMRSNTYITCVSEHPPEENEHGRLSMWRAYGGRSGVALVMNTDPFASSSNSLKAYSSPVMYANEHQIGQRFDRMVERIGYHRELLKTLSPEELRANLFTCLRFGVLCTKHPAFKEEMEWRVVYSPNLEKSPIITSSVQTVRGIPQIIKMIPLIHDPDNGLYSADVKSLIDRVIIGPTEDGAAVWAAFVRLLEEAGVESAHERVHLSRIPLRQFG